MTLFKVGDLVIITHYYENVRTKKNYTTPPGDIKLAILNKTHIKIIKEVDIKKDKEEESQYKLEGISSYMWGAELYPAKITNWRQRLR